MKTKIAVLVCLFMCMNIANCFSGVLETNERIPLGYFAQSVDEDNPMLVPVTPPSAQLEKLLSIDLTKVEEYATVTFIDAMGEKAFERVYFNVRFINIDPALLEKGVYQLKIELKDSSWEGDFYVD